MADHSVLEAPRTAGRGRSQGNEASAARSARGGRGRQQPAALPATKKRVRTPELALGILLAAGCGLGAVMWTSSASSTTPALVLARDVQRGEVLELADFAPAEARATGLRLVSYAEREKYVGRIAAIDLTAASAVTDSVALEIAPIADGEALAAVRVDAGEYPTGLRSGSTVQVVGLLDQAIVAALAAAVVTVDSIEVVEGAADEVVVTLRVPRATSSAIAAQKDIQLVEVAS
jgi:hypothetical protein